MLFNLRANPEKEITVFRVYTMPNGNILVYTKEILDGFIRGRIVRGVHKPDGTYIFSGDYTDKQQNDMSAQVQLIQSNTPGK